MSDKTPIQSFLAEYLTIEIGENIILLKPKQMITLNFADEKGEFKSVYISPINLAKALYDSVEMSDSSIGYFTKQSE